MKVLYTPVEYLALNEQPMLLFFTATWYAHDINARKYIITKRTCWHSNPLIHQQVPHLPDHQKKIEDLEQLYPQVAAVRYSDHYQ